MNLPTLRTRLFEVETEEKLSENRLLQKEYVASLEKTAYKAIATLHRLREARLLNTIVPLHPAEVERVRFETVVVPREDYERLKNMIDILGQYFEDQ
jgi:hypothetical protein